MKLIERDNHNEEPCTTHIVLHDAAVRMLHSVRLGPPAALPAILQALRLLLPATCALLLRGPGKWTEQTQGETLKPNI